MNGFVLVIPIILVRYVYLGIISSDGLRRSSFYPPLKGNERIAFWIYQFTTIFLLLYPILFKLRFLSFTNYLGLTIYIIGLVFYIVSIRDFSKPLNTGLNKSGIYNYSRNPMYVAFFLYFLGITILLSSLIYFFVLIGYQISVHYLILSEERWCIKQFDGDYIDYMERVRRYI